jgi:Cation transport protein
MNPSSLYHPDSVMQSSEPIHTVTTNDTREQKTQSYTGSFPTVRAAEVLHPDIHTLRSRRPSTDYPRSQILPTIAINKETEHGLSTQSRRIDVNRLAYHRGSMLPTPGDLVTRTLERYVPRIHETLSLQPTMTHQLPASQHNFADGVTREKIDISLSYFSFFPLVSRNSQFHGLTEDQLEELGGVEYTALRTLSWLIPTYYFGVQLLAFLLIAPWIGKTGSYATAMVGNRRPVTPTFFSAFQVISAFGYV